jgi:hypothetical protein
MFRLMPSDRAAAKRSMRAWQRSAIARHEPPFVAFLALSFDSLDEVLDEANGLIEAQHVVTTATRGPMFLTWNKSFIDGNDDPVPRVSSRRSRTSARP